MKRCIILSIIGGIAAGCFTMFGILGFDAATTGWVQLDNLRLPDSSIDVIIYRDISHLYKVDSNFIVLSTGEEQFSDWTDRLGLSLVPVEKILEDGVTGYAPHEGLSGIWIPQSDVLSYEHLHGVYRNHWVSALNHDGKVFIVAHRIWK